MLDKLPEGVKTLKKIRDTLNDELQGMEVGIGTIIQLSGNVEFNNQVMQGVE